MLSAAFGDALGAPVEFLSWKDIVQHYGPGGIRAFAPAYGRLGAITDDTQLAMATARGLLRGAYADHFDEVEATLMEYLRWHESQQRTENRRAPGTTCLSALAQWERSRSMKAANTSKGCGGVMRVHPVGLYHAGKPEKAYSLASACAEITHGHPTSSVSSGFLAALITLLVTDMPFQDAFFSCRNLAAQCSGSEETIEILDRCLLESKNQADAATGITHLGEGWVAEEALAIGIYSYLRHEAEPFEALVASVNHSGDSDSTGAICGAIVGAIHGYDWIPKDMLETLEHRDDLINLADRLNNIAYLPKLG